MFKIAVSVNRILFYEVTVSIIQFPFILVYFISC